MLKTRIIPTMLWSDTGLVKGVGFDSWRRVGTVLPSVKVYNMRQVDELILLDIAATKSDRDPDCETVGDLASECFVPLAVGGGIKNLAHIRELLKAGADKVCVNTALYETPQLLADASRKFGKQCMVASIDAAPGDGGYECFSRCGTTSEGRELTAWAKELEKLGAGEILVTSIPRDGTMSGYDIGMIRAVSDAVSIPVIASGGCGGCEDAYRAVTEGGASAAAMASIFHFTQQTPLRLKEYLASRGIPMRLAVK
ncbi:MAG: imidazole glycerol phosphate synthase cyclase subunit [Synergistaceae bacterium]|jgi:cyclase|nr:imidazole glycerol phosphate synthase cyclase subunit [Synergistaceae bacterium]